MSAIHAHHRTNTEVAWAAGLFEGEGTIARDHRQGAGSIRLQMNMTDEDVLSKFYGIVGVGTFTGPHDASSKNGIKPYWLWRCSTLDAIPLLEQMLPHLGARRSARAYELLIERHIFEERATAFRACAHCDVEFSPEYSHSAWKRIYCSSACKEKGRPSRRRAA